jgi:hypothetical protein
VNDQPPASGRVPTYPLSTYETPRAPDAYASPPPTQGVPNERALRGSAEPIEGHGPFAIVEALLKSPASVLHEIESGRGAAFRLSAVLVVTMILTGLVMAAFSGGMQLLWVPLRLAVGIFFCALICLPSLHIISCLAGAEQSLKQTWSALLMGLALMGILLVGFAPVSWVFAQATSSVAFMGALHLAFLGLSCAFGLGLVNRALSAMNRRAIPGLGLWHFLFMLVLLQMTTTLRPLVGPFDGVLFHDRMFFLAHWIETLG